MPKGLRGILARGVKFRAKLAAVLQAFLVVLLALRRGRLAIV